MNFRLLCASLIVPFIAHADQIVLVAGGTQDAVDIPATEARLKEPFGTEFDSGGHMWIVEMVSGNRLLQVDGGGVIQHVAGQPTPGDSGDGGQAIRAQFNGPHNLAILPDGKVLIGDTWNGRVRVVDVKARIVSTLEGWQAPAGKAKGSGPYCITLNFDGTKLYIADLRQVHELDLATHQSKVIAGNGKKGKPEDGALAADAPLVDPRAVAPDRLGNVYILERGGNALRVVDQEGRIRTVVNASGKQGGTGDGGPALEATMSGPKHLCVDKDNSVLIADAESHLVRRYVPTTGKIERIAGTGKSGSAGVGGDPKQCQLARPHGVTIHPESGHLYITDSYNNRVLKIVKQ
ncbi:NHL domain-containing protein [Prosthecobacter sp.]